MKKQIIIVLSALLFTVTSVAQVPQNKQDKQKKSMAGQQKRDKIKAMKVEFITTKLELSSEEAQKFWPLYNKYTTQRMELEKARRKLMNENRDKELSDEETNKLIAYNFDTDQKILDLRRAYDSKFKEVLSVKKVGLLYLSEREFKRELLRKMKKNGPPK